MKTLGVTVLRYEADVEAHPDGTYADYAAMLHFFKEALEHGFTLAEAIEACEQENGK